MTVQTLQDHSSLLKAQTSTATAAASNGYSSQAKQDHELKEAKFNIQTLEKELRVRDDIIHELEVRLTLPMQTSTTPAHAEDDSAAIEMQNLQVQLEALHAALATKDNEIEVLKSSTVVSNDLTCNGQDKDHSSELAKVKT